MANRGVQSIDAVLTIAKLNESRLLQRLMQVEARAKEQQILLKTLEDYGDEYRTKISSMDYPDKQDGLRQPLTQESLLRRQNLLAMIGKIDTLKSAQVIQVKLAEDEVQRVALAFQKSRLSVENLEELREKKILLLQKLAIKKEEKIQYDEYLTRF